MPASVGCTLVFPAFDVLALGPSPARGQTLRAAIVAAAGTLLRELEVLLPSTEALLARANR